MNPAASGVCLVRVEVHPSGLLLTVITEHHDPPSPPRKSQFTEIDTALAVVHDFLRSFRHGGLTSHAH
jgi:hypothetical protein